LRHQRKTSRVVVDFSHERQKGSYFSQENQQEKIKPGLTNGEDEGVSHDRLKERKRHFFSCQDLEETVQSSKRDSLFKTEHVL
jgi:hypothetical protein